MLFFNLYSTLKNNVELKLRESGSVVMVVVVVVQGGSNMTGTCAACLHRNQSRSYLNHLVIAVVEVVTVL